MNMDGDKFEIRETGRYIENIKEGSYLKGVAVGLLIALIAYCVITLVFMMVI